MRQTSTMNGGYSAVYTNGYASDGTCSNSNSSNSTAATGFGASPTVAQQRQTASQQPLLQVKTSDKDGTGNVQGNCLRGRTRRFWLLVTVGCISCVLLACAAVIAYTRLMYSVNLNAMATSGRQQQPSYKPSSDALSSLTGKASSIFVYSEGNEQNDGDFRQESEAVEVWGNSVEVATSNTALGPISVEREVCGSIRCPYGAKCMQLIDGSFSCQCKRCSASVGASRQPVCGSDNEDYLSECEMERAACIQNKFIFRKYYGKCDPCARHECASDQVCRLDAARQPVCTCGYASISSCADYRWLEHENRQVCGTDGVTYSSICELLNTACIKQTTSLLRLDYDGPCLNDHLCSASNFECGLHQKCFNGIGNGKGNEENGEISVLTSGRRCELNNAEYDWRKRKCAEVFRPVCGSDGLTYDSECELQRISAMRQQRVTIAADGFCEHSCSVNSCREFEECSVFNGSISCACPNCRSAKYEPVCDNNNMTHNSECMLRKFACENNVMLQLATRGVCNTCGRGTCKHYSKCVADQLRPGKKMCVCPSEASCEESLLTNSARPVCATDGNTYKSECHLRVASCTRQDYFAIRYHRPCEANPCESNGNCVKGMACKDGYCQKVKINNNNNKNNISTGSGKESQQICSNSDGVCSTENERNQLTNENQVEPVAEVNCTKSCNFGATCRRDPQNFLLSADSASAADSEEACVCNIFCNAQPRSPTCGRSGSALEVYENECILRRTRCLRQLEIEQLPLNECSELITFYSNFTFCDGSAPLVNNDTLDLFNCLNAAEPCPSGSYCHKNPLLGRCCPSSSTSETIMASNSQLPCSCDASGAINSSCDPSTLQCFCKPRYYGRSCEKLRLCSTDQFTRNNQCLPCLCNAKGSLIERCDDETGNCYCRTGFGGRRCDVCRSPMAVFDGIECVEQLKPVVDESTGYTIPTTEPVDDANWRPNGTRRVAFRKSRGSMCWNDADCATSVRYSYCLDGYCSCAAGRQATDGGRLCVKMTYLRSVRSQPIESDLRPAFDSTNDQVQVQQTESDEEHGLKTEMDLRPAVVEYRPPIGTVVRSMEAEFSALAAAEDAGIACLLLTIASADNERENVAVTLVNDSTFVHVCDTPQETNTTDTKFLRSKPTHSISVSLVASSKRQRQLNHYRSRLKLRSRTVSVKLDIDATVNADSDLTSAADKDTESMSRDSVFFFGFGAAPVNDCSRAVDRLDGKCRLRRLRVNGRTVSIHQLIERR